MKQFKFTSESFHRVIALCDLPDLIIRVCEKDFFINQSILPVIFPILEKYYSKSEYLFTISINNDNQSNSLFKSVTPESLIESCSIFVSFQENGIISNTPTLHLPSLLLFSMKIFSSTFLSSIIRFSSLINQSTTLTLSFEEFNVSLNSFPLLKNENQFSFKACSKVYKCSPISASIFSKRAFNILKNENQFCLEIECPEHIRRSRVEKEFENVFKVIYGFPLSLKKKNIESLLSIYSELENSTIFNLCTEFCKSNNIGNIERVLIILENSEILSENFDISSIVSQTSEEFEKNSFETLSNIHPSGISKILQSPKLKLKSEESLFEFLLKCFEKWKDQSISLFECLYFEYLKEQNLSKFFEKISKFHLPPSLVESLSFIFQSENRFVHSNRHSSQANLNSIHSLTEIRRQCENLKNDFFFSKESSNKTISQQQLQFLLYNNQLNISKM
jgi:hypothetical protein